jgi:hypothetical protein
MKRKILLVVVLGLMISVFGIASLVLANSKNVPQSQSSPIHPAFAFLDAQGQDVLASAKPVSTMQTCGQCHDVDYAPG